MEELRLSLKSSVVLLERLYFTILFQVSGYHSV